MLHAIGHVDLRGARDKEPQANAEILPEMNAEILPEMNAEILPKMNAPEMNAEILPEMNAKILPETHAGATAREPEEFDHADVCRTTGQVFVAHTAADRVDQFDGETLGYSGSVRGCPQGSGVLYCPETEWILAAARGTGELLVLDARTGELLRTARVGPRPNGLAWDPVRRRALVADVQDFNARCVDPATGETLAIAPLPGRPRWCVYDAARDGFWVNIMEPHVVQGLSGADFTPTLAFSVRARGPHGLALDPSSERLFVACDDARLIALSAKDGSILADTPLAGPPDAVWLNERHGLLYIAMGDPGCVQAVDAATYTVVDRVETEPGAHTLTFDETRQRLYVFLPKSIRAAAYHEIRGENPAAIPGGPAASVAEVPWEPGAGGRSGRPNKFREAFP